MTLGNPTAFRQGNAQLINTDLARRLLASTELARLVNIAEDGASRVLPMLFLAEADRPGTRMARTAVRLPWLGVLDSTTRFPGGGTAERFPQRGQ